MTTLVADETQPVEDPRFLPAWLVETPYWAVSAVLHLVLLLLLATIVLLDGSVTEKAVLSQLSFAKTPEPVRDPTLRREVIQRPKTLVPDEQPIESIKPDIDPPPGNPNDALATRPLDSKSVDDVLGLAGPGLPDMYRGRGHGTGGLVGSGTDDAVLAALEWLMRHQHEDGRWSSRDFGEQCRANRECKHANPKHAYTDGRGWENHDVGVTGLAMLAFLGRGHTHKGGSRADFRRVMKKAKVWMQRQQVRGTDPRSAGRFGPDGHEQWIYDHAIATMAMSELLGMSRDRFTGLPKSVTTATELCLRYQNPGFGWRYRFREGNDVSVTGWMILALKASKYCADRRLIKIERDSYEQSFAWALDYLAMTTGSSGRTGYLARGDRGSQLMDVYPDPYPYSKDQSCMTAVSVLCRLFAGVPKRDPSLKKGVAVLVEDLPKWRPASGKRKSLINLYHWYYASYALFQHGGTPWKKWNGALQKALLPTQRVGGCEDGSWDPIGEWGAAGGRVYATAIGAMTLEVYHRFVRLSDLKGRDLQSK